MNKTLQKKLVHNSLIVFSDTKYIYIYMDLYITRFFRGGAFVPIPSPESGHGPPGSLLLGLHGGPRAF